MTGGYMGKLLWVDLTNRTFREEFTDEKFQRSYIGGYGYGSKLLYDRQKGGIDALGPDNILGLVTGPLTGTPATFGSRFAAVGKSPLTGGWGDANCGGHFGPYLKFAGYDGVFFTGIADKPVYLLIDNNQVAIKDASHIWGKDTYQTEEILTAKYPGGKVVSIGPAGEKLSLIACIMNGKGDAAGRSGLGAVMGSKQLKAVVVRGDMKVPIAVPEQAAETRKEQMTAARTFLTRFNQYGTSSHADASAHSGDTPIKNWSGIGVIDLPDVSGLRGEKVNASVEKRFGCWHCPAACKASLKAGPPDYPYPAGNHRLEYETTAAFGANCGNVHLESINMASHICNAFGIDTISAGCVIAFGMECYERGLISQEDTGGINLTFGNHRALLQMLEKIVRREGFGDILADGVRIAAQKIGRGSEQFAVHIGGQELGMHDPKGGFQMYIGRPMGSVYHLDPTPGRHTGGFGPFYFKFHFLNAAGLCQHGDLADAHGLYMHRFMRAITGWDMSFEELLQTGERIMTMRHLFNLREGLNPLARKVHDRITGRPPQKDGPLAGVTVDLEAQNYWNLGALDWDRFTTKPSRQKLMKLGLREIADALWPAPVTVQSSGAPPLEK